MVDNYSELTADYRYGASPLRRRPLSESFTFDGQDGLIMFYSPQATFDGEAGDIAEIEEHWHTFSSRVIPFDDDYGIVLGIERYWDEYQDEEEVNY